MSEVAPVKPPHPWKRWCRNGHDTYKSGRSKVSKACVLCTKEKNKAKSKRDKAIRAKRNRAEYMPHLKAYRQKHGYTRGEIAWESAMPQALSLTVDTITKIEEQKQKASYRQRVAIFQAFNVLREREREAKEAGMEEGLRRVRAGVA